MQATQLDAKPCSEVSRSALWNHASSNDALCYKLTSLPDVQVAVLGADIILVPQDTGHISHENQLLCLESCCNLQSTEQAFQHCRVAVKAISLQIFDCSSGRRLNAKVSFNLKVMQNQHANCAASAMYHILADAAG